MKAYTTKRHPGILIPTTDHAVDEHGSVQRLFAKPTREQRKAKIKALKAAKKEQK